MDENEKHTSLKIFNALQSEINELIKVQINVSTFIDWEEWLEFYFNPLNTVYENCWNTIIDDKNITNKPTYIDFNLKIKNLIAEDCDMTLSKYD